MRANISFLAPRGFPKRTGTFQSFDYVREEGRRIDLKIVSVILDCMYNNWQGVTTIEAQELK